MQNFRPICAGWLLLLLASGPVLAQRNPTDVISQGTSYHVFAQPGEATIELLVLGDVAAGIYVVGADTNLSKLLALVGGAGSESQSPNSEVRKTVRLLRGEGGARAVVYEARLEEFLRNPAAHPALRDGDVFTVESETLTHFNLRETLSIVSSLGTLTLLVLRLIDASN